MGHRDGGSSARHVALQLALLFALPLALRGAFDVGPFLAGFTEEGSFLGISRWSGHSRCVGTQSVPANPFDP
jgi:hypothetical protein